MEKYFLDLSKHETKGSKSKFYALFILFLTIMYLMYVGFDTLTNYRTFKEIVWINLPALFLTVFHIYQFFKTKGMKKYILMDDKKIEWVGINETDNVTILWNNILTADLKVTSIDFNLKDKETIHFSFSNLSYKDLIQFKEKFELFKKEYVK